MKPPVRIDRDVDVPMRDGVLLRADVWRVDDDTSRPAILTRTPYNKLLSNSDFLRPTHCIEGGYAYVVQDTRGRFASEGDWGAIMWAQEADDTYDTVEWVAAQPWCDGNVGMAGPSYLGITQWMGASANPPHLRAIAPALATSADLEKVESGGAVRLDQSIGWLVFTALDWIGREMAAERTFDPQLLRDLMAAAHDPTDALEFLPLEKLPLFDLPGFPQDWRAMLRGDPGEQATIPFERIDIPTLAIGGWYDVFVTGTVEAFRRMRAAGAGGVGTRAEHRMIVGPWLHAGTLPNYQGELNFGVAAAAPYAQLPQKHLAFFDRHLKGEGPGLPVVQYFLMGADEWCTTEAWPPPEAVEQRWYLSSGGHANTGAGDGRLTTAVPTRDEPADTFVYDPADPVRTHGGRTLALNRLVSGPFDQSKHESRQDVLCYTSDELSTPVDAVGPVVLRLWVSSSAPDTDVAAKLLDVFPDGRVIPVAEGFLRLRYRRGFDREVLLEPGVLEEVEVSLAHTAWRFLPGHRMRVHVTSSNFPQFDRNTNTGNPVGVDAEGVPATQQVAHGRAHPSCLELTVLPGATQREEQS